MVPWLLAAFTCPGQDQPPPAKQETNVKVTVVVILASEKCEFVDPLLREVAAEARKNDPKLKGFKLVTMDQQTLAAGEKGTFNCVENATCQVLVKCCGDMNGKVCLTVTAPANNEITYKTVRDKFVPIVTHYLTKPRVPPQWVASALAQGFAGGALGPVVGLEILESHRCRDRLILAIRVEACKGK
jgi:hypothetical protein